MQHRRTEQSHVLWRLLFFFTFLTIVMFALYPNLKLSKLPIGIRLGDAVFHIVAFASITLVAGMAWRFSSAVVVQLVLFALALEFAQFIAPGREVHLSDAAASLGGIVVGGLALFASLRFRRNFLGWS